MLTKRSLILIGIGIGIFIVCFILLFIIGTLSLPKSFNEKLTEEYGFPPPTGGDGVRIRDDLIFFWPLVFTEGYDPTNGEYWWFADFPPNIHPLVLLYWAFVSFVVSFLIIRILRIYLKRKIKKTKTNKT